MNSSFDEIREAISKSETIAIAGHVNPDGDAIGACLGLANSILQMGKKPVVILEKYTSKYDIIPGKELVISEDFNELHPDLFISLDCGDKERLGEAANIFDRTRNINIDHHMSNTYFGEINYVDKNSSSTSEIIYKLINGYMPVDMSIASCLYAGIINDTGGFRHSNTSSVTMMVSAELLSYNIPFTKIYNNLYQSHTFPEAKLMGKAIENSKREFNNRLTYSTLSKEEIEGCNGTYKQLDGIVEYLKNVEGTFVSVFFYEKYENEIKVSFRSEDEVDVCEIAVLFGGGGHAKAAGCTIKSSIETAVEKVLSIIKVKVMN